MAAVRRPRPILALAFAFLTAACWLAVPVAADEEEEKNPKAKQAPMEKGGQPPKGKPGEEEDTKPGKPPKKIDVDDGGTKPPTEPGGPEPPSETPDKNGVYLAKFDDLARAAVSARHPALREYYKTFGVAFDRLFDKSGKTFRITPVPPRWQYDKYPAEFGVAVLDDTNAAGEPESMAKSRVRKIDHFEQVAIEETDKLLKLGADGPKAADRLEAAEAVLTKVMFFHESAREQERRKGKSWEPLKVQVYDKLTEVRIARLRQAGLDRDWTKQNALFKRAAELYKANPKVLEQVYASRLDEAELLVKSDKVPDLERGRILLNEFDSRFPNSSNELAKKIRQAFADQAKVFIGNAQQLIDKDPAAARKFLDAAGVIDPGNLSLRSLQTQAKSYATLVVGARRLPERMSPALARFDSERQAVELLFEGLLEAVPDTQLGVRYQLALAADKPGVGAGIRDVNLVRAAEWGADRGVFDASEVASTLKLMRTRPASWAADPATWLDEPGFDPSDPGRIRMRFRIGHPDPRGLLTLKLHPANWLSRQSKQIDDAEFALYPFGTGPFRLADAYKPRGAGDPPRDVVFVANPAYTRRPGKMGQPFIKEIQFKDVSQSPINDLVSAFRRGRMHILTDVATQDLPSFSGDNHLGGMVRVIKPEVDRRIHILAINHRRPALQNPDLRRGLLHAIDREKVLTDVYRGTQADAHKALTGPFPAGSWATPRATGAAAATLYNRDTAQGRLRAYMSSPSAVPNLRLAFPADDPLAQRACVQIKAMIELATATEDRKLTISLEPMAPRDLTTKVDELHDFDLAYVPFDYRDDWYPQALGSLLDPTANAPGGRNYLGYLSSEMTPSNADENLGRVLKVVREHREPAKLDQLAHDVHRKFNEAAPFVPLWQIDRHMVISTAVKLRLDGLPDEASARLLNPTTLFNSVGLWKVE